MRLQGERNAARECMHEAGCNVVNCIRSLRWSRVCFCRVDLARQSVPWQLIRSAHLPAGPQAAPGAMECRAGCAARESPAACGGPVTLAAGRRSDWPVRAASPPAHVQYPDLGSGAVPVCRLIMF